LSEVSGGSAHRDELPLATARSVIEDTGGDEASALENSDRATMKLATDSVNCSGPKRPACLLAQPRDRVASVSQPV
jgi:hypothetical protein